MLAIQYQSSEEVSGTLLKNLRQMALTQFWCTCGTFGPFALAHSHHLLLQSLHVQCIPMILRLHPVAGIAGMLAASGASSPSVLQGLRHVRGQCKRQSEIGLWEGRLGRDCTKIASEPLNRRQP